MPHTATASLLLVPNTLDLGEIEAQQADIRQVLPDGVLQRVATLTDWVAEDAKTTRAFLQRVSRVYPLSVPLQAIRIATLPRPPKGGGASAGAQTLTSAPGDELVGELLAPLREGRSVGLISEAGLPGVADPGAALVAAAHAQQLRVEVMSGPSSLTLAVAASGLNGQSFAFVGYLPQDSAQRTQRLRELERRSRQWHQTQVLIETPYRNAALAQALLAQLAPGTRLSISSGLTLPHGWSRTLTVDQWRLQPPQWADKVPAVFCFLA